MALALEIRSPHTGGRIGEGDYSEGVVSAVLNHFSSGGGESADIEIEASFMPDTLRRLITFKVGNSAEFSGVAVQTPKSDPEGNTRTLSLVGAHKRFDEIPLDEGYIPGGDIGAMVRHVLGNPKNLPPGFTWQNEGVQRIPNFGVRLGDRITRRNEKVGAFLNEMAKLLPGLLIPSNQAEYEALVKEFPEAASFSPGDYLPPATYGVTGDGLVFFGRRNSTQTLIEGDNESNRGCYIIEQPAVVAEELITAVRYTVGTLDYRGHALGIKDYVLDTSLYGRLRPLVGGVPRTFDFDKLVTDLNRGAPGWVRKPFTRTLGNTVSHDVIDTKKRNRYGLAYKELQVDELEPVFLKTTSQPVPRLLKGGLISGTFEDLVREGKPLTVRPNTQGLVSFALTIGNASLSRYDGFYIDAPGTEVAWYLAYFSSTEGYEIPLETKAGFANEGKEDRIFLFNKGMPDITDPTRTGRDYRLHLTLNLGSEEDIGGVYTFNLNKPGVPTIFSLEHGQTYRYVVKEGERFTLESGSSFVRSRPLKNGNTVTYPVRFNPEDVFEVETLTTPGELAHVTLLMIQHFAIPVSGSPVFYRAQVSASNFENWWEFADQVPFSGNLPSVWLTNATYSSGDTPGDDNLPYTPPGGTVYLNLRRRTIEYDNARVRLFAQPTMERTINAFHLVSLDKTFLKRMAQSEFKSPSDQNLTIYCNSFVNPSRKIFIEGRGTLYPSKFTDYYTDEEWRTVITVGQPESAEGEELKALVQARQ
jgi:hypothetical protein